LCEVFRNYQGGPGEVVGESGVPVCIAMCVYKKPRSTASLFRDLIDQRGSGGMQLFIWNNCWDLRHYYEQFREHLSGAFANVVMVHSEENEHALRRFPMGALSGSKHVVTFDDDITIGGDLTLKLVDRCKRGGAACGGFGRILHVGEDYWGSNGGEITSAHDGLYVEYLATIAACFESAWLRDGLVYRIPDIFRVGIEDMWLCFSLHSMGVDRVKINVQGLANYIDIHKDGIGSEVLSVKLPGGPDPTDVSYCLMRDIRGRKNECLKYLAKLDRTFFRDG